jgi:Tol biopolymer transport system component
MMAKDGQSSIALVSPKDGAVQVIKDIAFRRLSNKISFSPDGKYIVYDHRIARDSNDIRLIRVNGTGQVTLIKDNGFAPYWSPDGRHIFFLRAKNEMFDLLALSLNKRKPQGSPVVLREAIDFFAPLGFLNDGSFLFGKPAPLALNVYVAELDPTTLTAAEPRLVGSRFAGWNTEAEWSPDGRYLAYKSARDNGQQMVVLRSASTGEEEDISTHEGSIVQWFPDNTRLLMKVEKENGSKEIYRFNIKTKATTLLFDLASNSQKGATAYNPVLSADGKNIFYIESDRTKANSTIYRCDLGGGNITHVATFDTPDITSFSASPDGQYLSLLALYQDQEGRPCSLTTVSLETGNRSVLLKEPWGDPTKFWGLAWSPDSKFIHYVRLDHQTGVNHIWRIAAHGGTPQNTGITMTDLRMPRIHPDGKIIPFFGGNGWYKTTYEITAIKISAENKR